MSRNYRNTIRYESVKSLSTICLDYIIKNINIFNNSLAILPDVLKTRIIKLLTALPGRCSDITPFLKTLVHSNLREINFSSINIHDNLLKTLKICRKLNVLNLSQNNYSSLTTAGLIEVLPNFKNLVTFEIANNSALTDEVMKIVVENVHLREINISHCCSITDKTLEELAKLTELVSLDLTDTVITHDGIEALAKGSNVNVLRELRIAKCYILKHKSINLILRAFKKLEVFYFNNCNLNCDNAHIDFQNENVNKMKQLTWTVY